MDSNNVNEYADLAMRLRVSGFHRTPEDVRVELNFFKEYCLLLEKELEVKNKCCCRCRREELNEEKKQKNSRRRFCSWIRRCFRRGKSVDNDEEPIISAESA